MDIDLTDASTGEIVRILRNYPDGKLIIKDKRIFWSCDGFPTNLSQGPFPEVPRKIAIADKLSKMSDALGSMVGPPLRR